MNLDEVEQAKENGRRRLFRVRFPSIYGPKSPGFVCRTLLRGEIFRVFAKYGYPDREIPKAEKYNRVRVENDLFPLCVLDVPDKFTFFNSHALITTTIVQECLRRSGFIDGSEEQTSILKYGLRYANSIEGRSDAIILHYFPSIRPYDLEQMTYEEWSMRSMQAVLLAKSVDGKDLFDFLTPDPTVLNVFDPKEVEDVVALTAPGQAPTVKAPAKAKPLPFKATEKDRTESQRAELTRQLGLPPNISAQAIGLNQSGNPNVAIEKGETRMFMAGERYDVDKLRSKIRQDSDG